MSEIRAIAKVFITNKAAYGEGSLIGKWTQLPMDNESLKQYINDILQKGGGTEVFITDSTSNFHIGEYTDVIKLNNILTEVVNEKRESEFIAIMECLTTDFIEGFEILENGDYQIEWECDSLDDAARNLAEEFNHVEGIGSIPKHLIEYLNYDALGNHLMCSGWKHSGLTKAAIVRR